MMDEIQLTWRQAAAEDSPLLFALLSAEKAVEFAPLNLSPSQMKPLLDMQFRARQTSYAAQYPNALDMVLCAPDGTSVGRQLVDRQPDCYHIVDISVLPEHRNRGIGTWAIDQAKSLATLEAIPLRLNVMKSNEAARKLYERLGFVVTGETEINLSMEWRSENTNAAKKAAIKAKIEHQISMKTADGSTATIARQEVLDHILPFLREIGLTIELAPINHDTFLPGMELISNGIRVDLDALLYPGDLLHEAGHLAVMPPDSRGADKPEARDMGQEIAAQAWSYAACMHLNMPAEVVFHEAGYKGQARMLIAFYSGEGNEWGVIPGVPLLAWMGMTTMPHPGAPSMFPKMLHWLRTSTS